MILHITPVIGVFFIIFDFLLNDYCIPFTINSSGSPHLYFVTVHIDKCKTDFEK